MKKFASALAVAAALGAPAVASAQNATLTPYLTADVGIAFVDGDVLRNANDFDYFDSNVVSSVYGLRGSVDLGNGLKVIGHLEGDFNTASGDTHVAGVFRRAANVGVEGGFGRIELGTKLNPLLAFNGGSFAMGGNSVATNAAASIGYGHFFTNESITYTTKVGGLTAQLQYGFESNGAPYGRARESVVSGFANYDAGAFQIGAAYSLTKGLEGAADPDHEEDETTWIVGVGTTLAGVKLKLAYLSHDDDAAADKVDAWHIGAAFAVTPQLTVGGDYLQDDEGSSLLNVQARYTVSKNLMVYGLVNRVDNDAAGSSFALLHGGGYGAQNVALAGTDEVAVAAGMVVSF